MKKYSILFSAGFLVLGGCLNLPGGISQKTNLYDLNAVPDPSCKHSVSANSFTSISPVYHKMMTRQGNKLVRDEFNQWVQPPQLMLKRYYMTVFTVREEKHFVLNGNIISFGRQTNPDSAFLDVVYSITFPDKRSKKTLRLTTRIPLRGNTQADFAEAMQKAVDIQKNEICRFLEKSCKIQK